MRSSSIVLLGAFAFAFVACSSSSSGNGGTSDAATDTGSTNGPPRSEKMSDITPAQEAALCDVVAAANGGYGAAPKTVTCPDGSTVTLKGYADQNACVAAIGAPPPASCPATIGDAEDCAASLYNDPCSTDVTPACANYFAASCSVDSEPDGGTSDSGTSTDDASTSD